jgi:hypothetical protein
MSWDKKHYKQCKDMITYQLNNVPFLYAERLESEGRNPCPVEWAKSFIPMVSHCIETEDYEGAQAISDAIREFINKFSEEPVSKEALLIIATVPPTNE